MIPLITSRSHAGTNPFASGYRDVWTWDIPGRKNAVVVEHTRIGYAVTGPLLFPDQPFASESLCATTNDGAIEEARGHVIAVLTSRADETMALANAFAEDRAEVAVALVAVALGDLGVQTTAVTTTPTCVWRWWRWRWGIWGSRTACRSRGSDQ